MEALETHLRLVENLARELGGAERIETHISSLLLTSEFVYKLKKPLDLGFLDFSSLEKRRIGCEDELRLNRRTAPELYLGVVEIRGRVDSPEIGGSGPLLDCAVKMRRFEEANRLDHLLEQGRLSLKLVDELADAVAAFHESLVGTGGPAVTSQGIVSNFCDEVIAPMRANFMALLSRGDADTKTRLAQLGAWTEREFEALRNTLFERELQGFVRECHGDLHLANLALVDGRITLFDCIEFNGELRWVDVSCDLAFLTMDLANRGAHRFAHRLLDRYLAKTGDYGGLATLGFYQMYRAMVRAKICAIRLGQVDCDRAPIELELAGYMALGQSYLQPARMRLILMHGVSASGKSWVSQALLESIGAIRLRSDRERKRLFGPAPDLYGPECTQATYDRLLELCEGVLDAGYPVIVDATFLQPDQRKPFAALAKRLQIPMTIVHTHADLPTLQERLKARAKQADNISDATDEVLQTQLQTLEPLGANEPVVRWDTTIETPIAELVAQLH